MGVDQNKYKIIRKLGEGGFGEVFLIEKDNKKYALKKSKEKLSEKEIEQYNNVINIISKIDNQYIIKYYYSFQENNSFYIVMEFAGDRNLKQFINDYKNNHQLIPEKVITDIIIQLCKGLIDIHKNNLIHRDLTPDNIFINENNKIKIGDFGITKILTDNNKYTKSIIEKIHYIAPEIELGEKYNNKVDIYSLGCIIYELFTLNEYYIDKKIHEKECKINLEVYNSQWQELIESLTKKDYHKRPDVEEIFSLVSKEEQRTLFTYKESLFFDGRQKIKDRYYNEIKALIECFWCHKIVKTPLNCIKCNHIFCRDCFEENSHHFCDNRELSTTVDINAHLKGLRFICKNCSNEVKYENIENHIKNGCIKTANLLMRLEEKDFWELKNEKKLYLLKSKN